MKLFRFLTAFGLMAVAAGAVIFFFRQPATNSANDGIKIVAAENFWGDIARQIGGERVQVTSVIASPDTDPHLYESNAANAAAIAAADIVIVNGLGYDEFMDKILAAAPTDSRKVLRAADLSATSEEANPHIWYDTTKVELVAVGIEAALRGKDAAHAEEYRKNLETFRSSMRAITAALADIAAAHPGTAVAYTERVPQYLLASAGLRVVTPEGFARAIEEGNDASPTDTAAMQDLIQKRVIKALLYNSQATSPTTQRLRELATDAGIPVVPMTETMPADQPNFQAWQLDQIKLLKRALNAQ